MSNTYSRINKICETCGKEFEVFPFRRDIARFCSHPCYAKTVHLQKRTDKWYEMMRNRTPWNKGKAWSKEVKDKLSVSQKKRFERELIHRWKGTRTEYFNLHGWVRKQKGRANVCTICGENKKRIHWANLSGDYLKDRNDYIELCALCHSFWDKGLLAVNLFEWQERTQNGE